MLIVMLVHKTFKRKIELSTAHAGDGTYKNENVLGRRGDGAKAAFGERPPHRCGWLASRETFTNAVDD